MASKIFENSMYMYMYIENASGYKCSMTLKLRIFISTGEIVFALQSFIACPNINHLLTLVCIWYLDDVKC